MRKDTLAALIERVEQATAEQQGEVIAAVAKALSLYFRVSRMIDVEAHESAALALVPEGWAIDRFTIWPGGLPGLHMLEVRQRKDGSWWHDSKCRSFSVGAATPALALVAAALRARMESER